jgi:hypothetical protein
MRKIVALSLALFLSVGALLAEEIKGVFKKYEDGKVTITVEDKEKTFPVDTEAKLKFKGKDGTEKEVGLTDMMKFMKEGTKVTLTVEKDKVIKVDRERMKKTDK